MIQILLAALKILLLTVGGILALAVIILAALLFCAVWYKVEAGKNSDGLRVKFRFRWLFVTICGVTGKGGNESAVKIFGVKLPKGKKSKKEEEGADEKAKEKIEEKMENKKKKKEKKNEKKKEKKKKLNERAKGGRETLKGVFATGEFGKLPGYTKTLAAGLFRAIKPKRLSIRGVIGFEDPSNTAITVGAAGGFAKFRNWDIEIRGDFETARIEGEAEVRGRLRLWAVIFPLIIFVLKKPVWKILFPGK